MLNTPFLTLLNIILYDLLFSLYVSFLEPEILPQLRDFMNNPYSRPMVWIGVLILAALAAEIHGVYLKFKTMGYRMLMNGTGKTGEIITLKWGMLLIILHTAIGVSVMIFAFRAFGFDLNQDENMFRLFFLAALIREGIIIYFIVTARITERPPARYKLKNTMADLLLFFFSIIAFTSTWRVIPESSKTFHTESTAELMLFIFFSSILFLIYYLSCNMTSVYENFVTARNRKQLLYRFGSLFVVVACVIYPMISVKNPEKSTRPLFSDPEMKLKIMEEKILLEKKMKEMDKKK